MAARSPARFLAPLALLAFVVALFMVINNTIKDSGSSGTGTKTSEGRPANTPTQNGGTSSNGKKKGKRFYRVKAGDTPSSIALKTGVPLSQIQALNPDLDPQTLSPGQRLKLRR
jgi:LysM repeat protein